MSFLFAPGCALLLYKPDLAQAVHSFLCSCLGEMEMLLTCCRHTPPLLDGTTVINVCPGCDRRYRTDYHTSGTVSVWEVFAQNDRFAFPDYGHERMTIIDACPTRDQVRVHEAVRDLASKMRIDIVEPQWTRRNATCCGDAFHGVIPTDRVVAQMHRKAHEMPADEIVVYCVSCIKAMFVGGKHPRYLLDLLFSEDTVPQTVEPDAWHSELDAFIEEHKDFETTT